MKVLGVTLLASCVSSVYVPPGAELMKSGAPGIKLPEFKTDDELKEYLTEHHDKWFESMFPQLAKNVKARGFQLSDFNDMDTQIGVMLNETGTSMSPMMARISGQLEKYVKQLEPMMKGMIKTEVDCFPAHPEQGDMGDQLDKYIGCLFDSFGDPQVTFEVDEAPDLPTDEADEVDDEYGVQRKPEARDEL